MKLQISLDDDLVKRIDNFSDENYMSRSGFISQACTKYLNEAEMFSAVKLMSLAMRKIADTGTIDDEAMKQLEDFERVAKFITQG